MFAWHFTIEVCMLIPWPYLCSVKYKYFLRSKLASGIWPELRAAISLSFTGCHCIRVHGTPQGLEDGNLTTIDKNTCFDIFISKTRKSRFDQSVVSILDQESSRQIVSKSREQKGLRSEKIQTFLCHQRHLHLKNVIAHWKINSTRILGNAPILECSKGERTLVLWK